MIKKSIKNIYLCMYIYLIFFQDQVKEAKDHALDLFEHKGRVSSILDKYMSKRSVKKRDLK